MARSRLLWLVLLGPGLSLTESAPPGYLIEGITVIDVEAGRRKPDSSVLIEGPIIRRVGPARAVAIPPGYRRIDGRGMFLIPGLFDAHVHYVDPDTYGPLSIAHGVTFVRDMGGFTDEVLELRRQLAGGARLGPEMMATGAVIDGSPPTWPFSEVCDTPEQGRAAVRKLAGAGVDQIKVYSGLTTEVFAAVAEEARRRGLRIVGHLPEAVTLEAAMRAGQYTNEHLMGFGREIARLAGRPLPVIASVPESDVAGLRAWSLLDGLDKRTLQRFLRRVRRSGMVQCPTLVVHRGIHRLVDADAGNDPRLRFVSPEIRVTWEAATYRDLAPEMAALPSIQKLVGELHRASVPLMVGSDLGTPYVFAGSSVHDEMVMFAEAGIPPADVLRAATLVPARVLGVADRLGSVREGRTASLVLLRADPIETPANVREIEAVFLRGEYFDRGRLDRLVDQAREAAVRKATPVDLEVEVPGELLVRGVYRLTLGGMDVGTEAFAIGRDAVGVHLMALSRPSGGWDAPTALRMRYDARHSAVSADWQEFAESKTVARYAFEPGRVRASATVDGRPSGQETLEVPESAIVVGPMFAGDFFLLNRVSLTPGETRQLTTVAFGFDGWKPETNRLALTRLPDEDLARGGVTVRARRHSLVLGLPGLGEVRSETWSDERGVVLKSVLKLGFGVMTAVLE
jgi:imidazolonepropionase-like amidohydrolase